ncbi:preprotein translocase subunit TatB [Acetobacterium fimetarium]|uniref:Preprotein translocase subunit TatB n=1 Tax=Acetobacterium fimetarium TaxID=52691 RepID=A0ABR6WST5_9FIRM|nr:sulfurtransferase TusA family protein [Acetobacterium fimetarium]MBC3803673.1 preprotein translocase subunit TatB [Acetobacterium fimetarium]
MLDARGRSCPEPVIILKKAMISQENSYTILVDNKTALENITRYAEHNGYQVAFTQSNDDFTMILTKK